MKYLLTGEPGVGKSTLLRRLAELLDGKCFGVVTEDIREGGQRVGFQGWPIADQSRVAIFAHKRFASNELVGDYGVDVEAVDRLYGQALEPIPGKVAIVDEIGRMQARSSLFLERARALFDDSALVTVASILGDQEKFAESFRLHPQSVVIEVTPTTREWLVSALAFVTTRGAASALPSGAARSRLLELTRRYFDSHAHEQLRKLHGKAGRYLSERRIGVEDAGRHTVHGDHGSYEIEISKEGPKCCCDLARGANGYVAGHCSHVQALYLAGLIPSLP